MKKKLRLDLDTLRVQSFSSSDVPAARGTVRARSYDEWTIDFCQNTGRCEYETAGPCTIPPNYCDPNSLMVECVYDPSLNSCGCVTPVT